MKINVGCGYKKLEGYINVDFNPDVKPDFVMPAWNLDFEDSSANEILADQVIEHLGFFKTKYFLSEAQRILRKDKYLVIKTPDVVKSFELFLKADDRTDRERILGWIYGSETEGMNHVYCFPEELLGDLLSEFGFEIIKAEKYDYEYLRPAIEIVAVKKEDSIKNKFRKKLVLNDAVEWKDEIYLSETENLIKEINLDGLAKHNLYEFCFISPLFALSLNSFVVQEMEDEGFFLNLHNKGFLEYIFKLVEKKYSELKSIKKSYEFIRNEFFDSPIEFIYNFIEKNRFYSNIKFKVLTEKIIKYEFSKRGIYEN